MVAVINPNAFLEGEQGLLLIILYDLNEPFVIVDLAEIVALKLLQLQNVLFTLLQLPHLEI